MEFCSMGDLSNYIKRRGDVSSIATTDSSAPPLKPTTNGLNEYVVRHFLLQLGILKYIHFIFGNKRHKFIRDVHIFSMIFTLVL